MRFKIDENLHDDVAVLLSQEGHDAQTVHDEICAVPMTRYWPSIVGEKTARS
jgi:hypothetical protein